MAGRVDRNNSPEPTQIHVVSNEEIADRDTAGKVAIDLLAVITARGARLTTLLLAGFAARARGA